MKCPNKVLKIVVGMAHDLLAGVEPATSVQDLEFVQKWAQEGLAKREAAKAPPAEE